MMIRWLKRLFRRNRETRLLCMRLDEMVLVHPDQIPLECDLCHAAVGVYPSGQEILLTYPNTTIVCNRCADDIDISQFRPAPGVERELGKLTKAR